MNKRKSPKQLSFWKAPLKSHGGAASLGKEKKARPIATKKPMHVILRSGRARGEWSLLSRQKEIEETLRKLAKKFHVRVYSHANVGNHLHLLLQAQRREDFQNFLRVFPQAVVFLVTGARKGKPVGRFWDALAFSRIVEWGKDFENALDYLKKNLLEGRGMPRDRVDWWFGLKKEILKGSQAL